MLGPARDFVNAAHGNGDNGSPYLPIPFDPFRAPQTHVAERVTIVFQRALPRRDQP